MTDDEWVKAWLADEDFDFLLDFLGGIVKPSERKLRLFACACARSIWHLLTDEACREAIEVAEAFADGRTSADLLRTTHSTVDRMFRAAWEGTRQDEVNGTMYIASKEDALASDLPGLAAAVTKAQFNEVDARDTMDAATGVTAHSAIPPDSWGTEAGDRAAEQAVDEEHSCQVRLFRCIMGNPFQPVAFDPSWRTANVIALAQTIYDERAFDHLPILADALEEAGCDNADIMVHCRGPGSHVRGCWVVDLVLNKE